MSHPLTLPEWFVNTDRDSLTPELPRRRRGHANPIRRAVAGLAEAITRELIAPLAADSWLARVEARAKTIGLLALTVSATFLYRPGSLAILLAVSIMLAVSSGIRLRRLGRVWLGVPLFSLAIVLPATLNLVTHGPPLLTLWHFRPGAMIGPWALPEVLAVTQSGLIVAGRLILRSLDCVSLMFVLVATTDPGTLIASLRRLGMPRAFGMVLAMAHRYLVVVLRAAEEIHLAKVARTIRTASLSGEQRWVGAGAGILFRKTYRMAQDVHAAMVSRGYNGEPQVGPAERWRLREVAWLAGTCGAFVLLLLVDRWA